MSQSSDPKEWKNSISKPGVAIRLHKFQAQAYKALSDPNIREIALIAGIQSGKTTFGALALYKLMCLDSRPDLNWLVTAPNYKILEQSTLPTFMKIFKHNGFYNRKYDVFEMPHTKVFFRTGTHPDSPEGIPNCAGAWMDEAGQCSRLFKINVNGRVARLQGKTLYTSTPYALNWLYSDVEKVAKEGRSDICFIQFSSQENPSFPKEEFERQRQILDARTFRRKYMGLHERMTGLVYELNEGSWADLDIVEKNSRYFAGVDFGFVEGHEFAVIVRAICPSGKQFTVNSFKQAGLNPNDQVQILRSKQLEYGIEHFYCDPARPDMISLLNKAGLRASGFHEAFPKYKNIIPSIEYHRWLLTSGTLRLIHGQANLEDEYETYHYPEDSDGDIKKEVPVPTNDHILDCIAEGSLVRTLRGLIPIERVTVGDYVLTREGWRSVLRWIDKGIKPCVKIKFSNGAQLLCTENHRIWLDKKGWTEVHNSRFNDFAWYQSRNFFFMMGLFLGGILTPIKNLFGFITEKAGNICIAIFGKSTTVPYRLSTVSITRMGIPITMIFQIWSAFLLRLIAKSTRKILNRLSTFLNKGGISKIFDLSLQIGIALSMGESGTGKCKVVENTRGILGSVTFALANIVRGLNRNFVIQTVRLERLESVGERRVYDLTIEGQHEFFANNILVHNCERYCSIGTMGIGVSRETHINDRFDPTLQRRDHFNPKTKISNKSWESY